MFKLLNPTPIFSWICKATTNKFRWILLQHTVQRYGSVRRHIIWLGFKCGRNTSYHIHQTTLFNYILSLAYIIIRPPLRWSMGKHCKASSPTELISIYLFWLVWNSKSKPEVTMWYKNRKPSLLKLSYFGTFDFCIFGLMQWISNPAVWDSGFNSQYQNMKLN